jgi:hypothetical protein
LSNTQYKKNPNLVAIADELTQDQVNFILIRWGLVQELLDLLGFVHTLEKPEEFPRISESLSLAYRRDFYTSDASLCPIYSGPSKTESRTERLCSACLFPLISQP